MKILVIIPSPTMKRTMEKIVQSMNNIDNIDIVAHVARVEDVAKVQLKAVDAIVSRGYSYIELKKRYPDLIHIPMEITGYDILRAVNDIRKHYNPKKVAFCGGYRYMSDSLELEELLGCPLQVYYNEDFVNIHQLVEEAKLDGCDMIFGGYSVVDCANKLGLQGVMFQTSEEAIRNAITEAVRAVNIKHAEQIKAEMYRMITKNANEGILFVHKDGIIGVDNEAAQAMGDGKALCHRPLQEVFPQLVKAFNRALKGKRNELLEMMKLEKDRKVMATIMPVISRGKAYGAVINLEDISRIQEIEGSIRTKLSEKGLEARYSFDNIVYCSETMAEAVETAKRYANADANIIIVGETGTGKELFAQSIHNYSSRKRGPFVAVNCAALPENLLESELFGYMEGAFTGAGRGGKMGMVEQAHKGTLFLDEVSEIPVALQIKLLRVIQEREVRRLGSDNVTRVDVRIIAATNKSLAEQVSKGEFRSDLLYRLDVLRLFLPPLSKRKGDIQVLFNSLLKDLGAKNGMGDLRLSPEAIYELQNYSFRGNVRELRNIVERISVLYKEGEISGKEMKEVLYPHDLAMNRGPATPKVEDTQPIVSENSVPITLSSSREELEYRKLLEAKEACKGKKSQMAAYLHIDRTTLWRKLKKYSLE